MRTAATFHFLPRLFLSPSALSGARLIGGNGQRHRGFRGLAFLIARCCPAGAEISKPGEVAASSSKKVREHDRKAENVDSEGSDGQTCTDLRTVDARLGRGRHTAAARPPGHPMDPPVWSLLFQPAWPTSQRAMGHDYRLDFVVAARPRQQYSWRLNFARHESRFWGLSLNQLQGFRP